MDRDTIYFLCIVFTVSYVVESIIIIHYLAGKYSFAYTLLFLLMIIPSIGAVTVAVAIRGEDLLKYGTGMGNIRYLPIAFAYPIIAMLLAAVLMEILGFPIDWGLSYLKKQYYLAMQEYGISPGEFMFLLIVDRILSAFFTTIFAAGEEIGWRGYLFEKLRSENSIEVSLILTGTIWAIWHAPLIVFIGYNYRILRGYGLLIFIPFCISVGTVLVWLKYRSGGILAPSLAHGTINAMALMGFYMYSHSDLFSIVVGIPAVIIHGALAIVAYLDLKKIAPYTSFSGKTREPRYGEIEDRIRGLLEQQAPHISNNALERKQ